MHTVLSLRMFSREFDSNSADFAAWGITRQAANTPTGDLKDFSPETFISDLNGPVVSSGEPPERCSRLRYLH
jgi:hypothetical protein